MDNPVKEIPSIIHLLTQSPPSQQRQTIDTYFTANASFTHPLCRTGSWSNSRFLIWAIYRWYKILSPRIDINVNGVAFDEANLVLYVNISQVFRIWLFPFYRAPVTFVTVIRLDQTKGDGKYYIASQDDLYQVDQWVKFIPFVPASHLLVLFLHSLATLFCLLGTIALWPVSFVEERFSELGADKKSKALVDGIELRDLGKESLADS